MSQDVSIPERNIATNGSEKLFQPVKEYRSVINKSHIEFEQFFARNMPFGKRAVDIVVATLGMICLSPLFLVISVAIKLTSKGPILYIQERTGQNLSRFKMYKFRSMRDGADGQFDKIRDLNEMSGPLIKIKNDPRLTPIGWLLRKTSLDELPQFFNILKGDMTIVGPRALSPLPSQYENWQLRRFYVRPGLTCTWQAKRRGEMDFREWMRCDLEYIDKTSFWRDLLVVGRTVLRVISLKGAH